MPRCFTTTNEAAQLRELEAKAALARSLGITEPQPVTLPEPPQDINTEFASCFHEISTEAVKATNHQATTTPHTNPSVRPTATVNQGGSTTEPHRVVIDHRVVFGGQWQVSAGQNSDIEPPGGVSPPSNNSRVFEGADGGEGCTRRINGGVHGSNTDGFVGGRVAGGEDSRRGIVAGGRGRGG